MSLKRGFGTPEDTQVPAPMSNSLRYTMSTPMSGRSTPTPRRSTPTPRRAPILAFSPGGNLINNNFQPKSNVPKPKVACSQYKTGFRGEAFRTCLIQHLQSIVRPLYAKMNAAKGNQALMNSQCSQVSGLSPHQIVIYEIAKLMAVVPTEDLGEHRGLLAYQGTGSGKTVTSLAIIMAFWASEKKIVLVSSKSNTAQALASYRREAPRFFPAQVKSIAVEYKKRKHALHLTDTEAFSAALAERVKGLTFVEARNRIAAKAGEFKTVKSIPLHAGEGSVMIIDEAQGLAVKSRADPQGDAIKLGCALRRLSRDQMRKIRIFAMTATPGNSIKQWLKLLSVVRRADQAPFTLDNDTGTDSKGRQLCDGQHASNARDDALTLQARLRGVVGPPPDAVMKYVRENLYGLVAYVDIRSDLTRHACVKELIKEVPLDRYYYLALLKFNAADRLKADRGPSEVAQHRFDPRMPDVFMKRMRVLGNSLPKTVWSTLPKDVQEELVRRKRILKINNASEGRLVSPKLVMLADYLATKPGKHYCYTVSGNEFILGTALTTWHRVIDVTRRAEAFDGAHYNRATKKIVGMSQGRHMIILNDTTTKKHRERLVGIFNSPENANGDYIRIVIASGQLYEGLDLAGLRHVSLADPLPTPLQELQAIGRGARNCSHRGLAIADRNVTIVRWFSAAPAGGWGALVKIVATMKGLRGRVTTTTLEEEYGRLKGGSYDQLVFRRARQDPEYLVLYNWERIMKAMAIDCQVLSRYHPGITCGSPNLVSKISMSAGTSCPL